MATWTGSFNPLGSPTLKLQIGGMLPAQDFEAIIDTGFSGFILMPVVQAFPLGLILFGTTGVVLADGSRDYKYTAMGTAIIGTEKQAGLVILEPSSTDILVGMDFLKKFSKTLFVHDKNQLVALFDDADVEDLLKKIAVAVHAQQAGTPAPASQNPPAPQLVADAEHGPIEPATNDADTAQ